VLWLVGCTPESPSNQRRARVREVARGARLQQRVGPKLDLLERKLQTHHQAIVGIFNTIRKLMAPPPPPAPPPEGRPIGFKYQRFLDKGGSNAPIQRWVYGAGGRGQYLGPTGRLWREPTKILVLMYPPDPSKSTAIDQIRSAYKVAFQQESVMRVNGTTCVAF
jgi:hypothetical protein